jgi:hypothetical protein
MAHDSQFPRTTIRTTTAPMMTPVMLNKRTRLLQYLQISDGHHGIPAMWAKPTFASQRTEHRSLSDFPLPHLAQMNMINPWCC